MRIVRFIRSAIVASACVGMLLPTGTLSAIETGESAARSESQAVRDIALAAGGRLSGRVLDADGQPAAAVPLALIERRSGTQIDPAVDASGRFVVEGLAGGTYLIQTPHGSAVCRCWAAGTAPPHARGELLVVADERVARGQRPLAEALFSTPTLLVLMIAAAIIIPIAVHNSKDAS